MRHYTKYQLPTRKKKSRGRFIWILAALFVTVGIWIWRDFKKSPPSKSKTAQSAQTNQPAARPVVVARPAQTNAPPPPRFQATDWGSASRPVQNIFEAQIALERLGISSGSIDGVIGSQTRAALRVFQETEGLPLTGELDAVTKTRLLLTKPALTTFTITSNDLPRLLPLSKTWLGRSQQPALDYENILELAAERGHAHPNLIRQLNPNVDWANVVAGTVVQIPGAKFSGDEGKAAFAIISLSEKTLEAFDAATNLIAHFPCSIAARVEKRPVGELHVAVIAPNPNYTFDPEVFPESAEARQLNRKLILPPGPNNPVGVAWIGLDKPGYGMHGTPSPEQVGRTESHGCFRLANWNAERLINLVWIGMPVFVEQ